MRITPAFILCVAVLLGSRTARSDDAAAAKAPDAAGLEFFEKKVRPLLAQRCSECHGDLPPGAPIEQQMMMRGPELIGGSKSKLVVPGEPDKSKLIEAVRWTNPKLKMPKKEKLPQEEIAILEQWVKMGAPDPRATAAATRPTTKPSTKPTAFNYEQARKFWSFVPVHETAAPQVRDVAWPVGAIDQFVLAKLEENGLRPNAAADKQTLIRRATYDLTGLPPTPEQVEAFVKDTAPDAFARVVDRLLASPAYGERWGRHWLDLVRYADTSGCNSDFPIPSAYRYRNYVINAFNQDKPYDQFVTEQLAGDLMESSTDAQRDERNIATGYLAISRRFGSRNAENHLTREDTIDNLGKTFLGLSVSCARCHDHKFDPIPNEDYYALYGILDSTKYPFPGTEIYRHTKDFYALGGREQKDALRKWERELAELDDKIESLGNERAKLKAKAKAGLPAEENGRTLSQVQSDLLEVKTDVEKLDRNPPEVEKAYAVSDGKPANTRLQRKGDPASLGEEVPRGFLQVLGGQVLDAETAKKTSGRLQLAQWIANPKNPLTARVMVNRIWQGHFGRGIVATPNDFGARGRAPTHPELLDYLAARFLETGWSVKQMHRAIMLSRAYHMSSADNAAYAERDPNAELLWRFTPRRLSAEEVRDSMLAVAGALDKTMPGPHPFPPEAEWRYTQHKPFVAKSSDYDTNHRSVYLMQQRIRKQPYLAIFDGADTNAATGQRALSTTPIQSLFLMNDPFVHDMADKLAVRAGMAFSQENERIGYLFELAFNRSPAADESAASADYVHQCQKQLESTDIPADQRARAAWASLARVMLGSNEFLFVN